MSSAVYAQAKTYLASGLLNLLSSGLSVVPVTAGYTPDFTNHVFLDDVPAEFRTNDPAILSGKQLASAGTDKMLTCNPASWLAHPVTDPIVALVLFEDTGTEGTSKLIAYLDYFSNLPLTPDGVQDVVFTFPVFGVLIISDGSLQGAGVNGEDGADGADGTDGVSATTTTTADFTQPAVSSTVTVSVVSTAGMVEGQVVYVEGGGYYLVDTITDINTVDLENLGYAGNASPSANVPDPALVGPGGIKGTDGSGGGEVTVDTFANRPASPEDPSLFWPTDGGFHQVYDGTDWYNVVGGVPLKEPPATATIATQTNFGTSSLTKTNGCLIFDCQETGTLSLRLAGKSIVTLASAVVTAGAFSQSPAGNFAGWAVYMRESSTDKILSFHMCSGSGQVIVSRGTWANATSRSSNTDFSDYTIMTRHTNPTLLRMKISGANVLGEMSIDGGLTWKTYFTIAKTTAFTTEPNEFGIAAIILNGSTPTPTHTFFTLSFAGD